MPEPAQPDPGDPPEFLTDDQAIRRGKEPFPGGGFIELKPGKCVVCGAAAGDRVFFCDSCAEPIREAAEATEGKIHERRLDVEWGGACPVQGTGLVDGHPCYFRSRHDSWSFECFAPGTDLEAPGPWPDPVYTEDHPGAYAGEEAGWVEAAESEKNIRAAVARFRARPMRAP